MKRFSDKILIIAGCVFYLAVWYAFLLNPVHQAIKSSEIIMITYFVIFFLFSTFAFIGISFILQRKFASFIKIEREKREILKSLDDQSNPSDKENKSIWDIYKSTFFKSSSGKICTMAEAGLYFSTDSVMAKLAPHTIKYSHHISETFIGMGVLGTFLGFSIGMKNIDFGNTDNMISNIETLIHSGFAIAFNTSIVGIICSVIYRFFIYTPQINSMDNYFRDLSDDLDSEYYISSTQVIDAFNSDLVKTLSGGMEEILDKHVKNIGEVLTKTINDEVLKLKDALNKVVDKLSQTPDALEETYKTIVSLKPRLSNSITELGGKIKKEIEECQKSFKSLIDPIKEIESSSKNVLSEYKSIAQKFGDASASFANTQKYIDKLTELDRNTQKSVSSISESLEKLEAAGKQSQKNISDAETALSGTERLLKEFTEIDARLADIFKGLNDNIQEYIASVSATYKIMLKDKKELMK